MPVTEQAPRRSRRVSRAAAAVLALALALVPAWGASAASPGRPAAPAALGVAGSPVSLAILVPLTVRPTSTGLIDSPTLAGYTAPLGVLTRQLDAVIGTPAVIGLDPMIVASIRVLGNAAPASAIAWLQRLQDADNEIFALSYADADTASLARIGALGLRDPLGFDFALDAGHFSKPVTASPTPTASATPSATPTPGDATTPPPLPTSVDEVLDWAYTLDDIAWPADDGVDSSDLEPLHDAGYTNVVVSSTNMSTANSGTVDLGALDGIVADAGITSLVREATYATGTGEQQDAIGRLNSALAGMEAVSPGRTVVATLDRHWPLGALNLGAIYADLETQPSVTTVGLTTILAGAHPDAQIVDEAGDDARDAKLRSLLDATNRESAFATAATTPGLVLEPRRLELLSLLAVTWLRGTDDWDSSVTTFQTESATLLDSVKIVRGSDLFVGAGQTNIPVTVSNALTVPVTVYVNVTSTGPVLQVRKGNVALTVEPGSSNKAAIPVQALSNGKVITTVTITSGTGVALGQPDYVDVDLQPGWESVGTTIIVILLVLIFGGGIVRTFLKRRTARRAAAADADPDAVPQPTEALGD